MTLLLVEDDKNIRTVLSELLEMDGFQVLQAENGQMALDLAGKHEFSLVILDLMMPVMDGWAFLAEREKIPALARVPVIVISACALTDASAVHTAQEFVKKPLEIGTLLDLIRKHART